MKRIDRVRTTSFTWWREDREDVLEGHVEELESHAEERIHSLTSQGYLSGELLLSLPDSASGQEEAEVQYRGWFESRLTPVTHA